MYKTSIVFLFFICSVQAMNNTEASDSLAIKDYIDKNACWLAQGSGINGIINSQKKTLLINALKMIVTANPKLQSIQCHPSYRILLHYNSEINNSHIAEIQQINSHLSFTAKPQKNNKKWLSIVFGKPVDLSSLASLYKKCTGVITATPVCTQNHLYTNNLSLIENDDTLIFCFTDQKINEDQVVQTFRHEITYSKRSDTLTNSKTLYE